MTKPIRIQRKRTKGWRMPANAVYVGRRTPWGNPFVGAGAVEAYREWIILRQCTAGEVVALYASDGVEIRLVSEAYRHCVGLGVWENLDRLRGKDLACFCPLDKGRCHASVLLELANA